ncbi:MAG: heavy metal-responsive transcriptional regulator [Chloroflexaceae bacterium]|nr:heavy metal-responsive transcriptional regulator [Chloroflexaceae bacterium]
MTVALPPTLKIGDVAAHSGLSVKTIRYYDELGLLSAAVRRGRTGYRLFEPKIFNRLAFIKRAQSLGLSLEEIKEILAIRDGGELPCDRVKERLQEKLVAIAAQIAALEMLKSELQTLLAGWQEDPAPEAAQRTICPNLQRDTHERDGQSG